jgi:hypothetical protein
MNNEQHQEDTKYLQWQDGMYVMLDELTDPLDEQEYVLALVENSLRDSVYYNRSDYFLVGDDEELLGVRFNDAELWFSVGANKLTRAQALYIATGDTTCIGY